MNSIFEITWCLWDIPAAIFVIAMTALLIVQHINHKNS